MVIGLSILDLKLIVVLSSPLIADTCRRTHLVCTADNHHPRRVFSPTRCTYKTSACRSFHRSNRKTLLPFLLQKNPDVPPSDPQATYCRRLVSRTCGWCADRGRPYAKSPDHCLNPSAPSHNRRHRLLHPGERVTGVRRDENGTFLFLRVGAG